MPGWFFSAEIAKSFLTAANLKNRGTQAVNLTPEQNRALSELAQDERLRRLHSALGADAELHLVGGSIRNVFLGLPAGDLDLATVLLPEEVLRRLSQAGIRTFPTGLKHQTVTALPIEGQEAIEITTFRGPSMSPKGGVVASVSIEEDLRFRDFRMNSLAFSLNSLSLLDPEDGLEDLKKRRIRTPGQAEERFQEDPLRVLRLIRFACAFNLEIDESCELAAKKFSAALAQVSVERIRDEFVKILLSPSPSRGLRLLSSYGFLAVFAPELEAMNGVEQNEFHYADVFEHTLEVIEKTEPDEILRLSALLHDVGKPSTLTIDPETGFRHFYHHEAVGTEMTRVFLSRLRFPNACIEAVAILVSTHMRPLEVGPGGMRRILRDTGDYFEEWRKLKLADASSVKIPADELAQRFREFDELLEIVKQGPPVSPLKSLAINGRDLLEMGFREGPQIGDILRALHEQVLDDPELNTKEELLRRAEAYRGDA